MTRRFKIVPVTLPKNDDGSYTVHGPGGLTYETYDGNGIFRYKDIDTGKYLTTDEADVTVPAQDFRYEGDHIVVKPLDEVVVTAKGGPRFVAELYTDYPSLHLPIGHSSLTIRDKQSGIKLGESKRFKSRDYNLVLNNCSNGTAKILEHALNRKRDWKSFTTPGDVYDWVNRLGFKSKKYLERSKDKPTIANTLLRNTYVQEIPLTYDEYMRAVQATLLENNNERKVQDNDKVKYDYEQIKSRIDEDPFELYKYLSSDDLVYKYGGKLIKHEK